MGRPRILGLEVAVKGVDEEHDVAVGHARSTEVVGSPARQRTAREAQWALEQRGGEIREWRHARRERRVARQEPDRPRSEERRVGKECRSRGAPNTKTKQCGAR